MMVVIYSFHIQYNLQECVDGIVALC
jgi:hypothetical protein